MMRKKKKKEVMMEWKGMELGEVIKSILKLSFAF